VGYAAAGLGGLAVGVAASALARGGGGGDGGGVPDAPPPPRPPSWPGGPASPLEGRTGASPPSPSPSSPPPPDDDVAEDAAAAAAIAASLASWPLPMGKLACDVRPHPPSDGTTTSTSPPRPVVLVAAGAFNPPTIAHLRMCEAAAAALRSAGTPVLGAFLSPVGDGYKKPDLAPAAHRVAMCEAAVAGVPGLAVDAWEALEGTGGPGGPPTRTLHVLRRVRDGLAAAFENGSGGGGWGGGGGGGSGGGSGAAVPPTQSPLPPRVMLVCGSDLLASLAKPGVWKPAHLAALAGPDHGIVCVGRAAGGGDGDKESTADAEARAALAPGGPLAALAPSVIYVADPADLRGVSSSLVRAALAGHHPVRWLAPQAVLEHAARHGLYGCVPGAGLAGVSGGEGVVRGVGDGGGGEKRRGPAAGTDV
jgi:nicotinamide mononucleotide adenylyltransferase